MDIPIETSRRVAMSQAPRFSHCQIVVFRNWFCWYLSHPSPLSVYRYSPLCSLALRLELYIVFTRLSP